MADQILDQVRDLAEGQIVSAARRLYPNHVALMSASPQDFEGQKLADLLATLVLSASGVSSHLKTFNTISLFSATF